MSGSILDGYYTKAELARALGLTIRTLDRYESLRIGPPRTRVGRQFFYHRERVSEWLEAGGASDGRNADAARRRQQLSTG